MRRRFALLLLLASVAVPAAAQREAAIPKRPKLEGGASVDTNDTYAYYRLGLERITSRRPDEAVAAFWWASRLDPTWADPVYARRVATLLSRPDLLNGYMEDNDRVLRSPEMKQLDSLQLRAVSLNPFLHRRLDAELVRGYLRTAARQSGEMDAGTTEFLISRYLSRADGEFRAWMLYSESRFKDAAKLYEGIVDRAKPEDKGPARAALARIYFQMGDYPRATEQLTRAVAEMRKGDEKELTHVYESKAIYEHGVAMLQEMREHKDSAKAAYQRALEEDVSYWPAHRQLGQLLLATGDTAGAITELEQAVQLKEDDAGLRYQYGWALTMGNRAEDAVAQFKKAVELDPDYAAPYFLLGRIYDLAEMSSDAQTWYKGYIARAPAADRQLSMAKQRLVALLAADAAASSKPAKP